MTKSEFKMKLVSMSLCFGIVVVNIFRMTKGFDWIDFIIILLWFGFYIIDFKDIVNEFTKNNENNENKLVDSREK
mgnify:CR=1 FL=1